MDEQEAAADVTHRVPERGNEIELRLLGHVDEHRIVEHVCAREADRAEPVEQQAHPPVTRVHPGEPGGHENADAREEDEELLASASAIGDGSENRRGCGDQLLFILREQDDHDG